LATNLGVLSPVNDNTDGTYTATLTSSTTAGTATITGTLNGPPIIDGATVTFLPGPASRLTSTITANPTSIVANGSSTSTITVQLKDANGNDLTTGGDTVNLFTDAGSLTANPPTDNGNGTYTATLTSSTITGVATVTGTLNGPPIIDDAQVNITPGPATKLQFQQQPSTTQAGATISPAVTVRALDVNDNLATGFVGSVSIAILSNPGSGTLSGTASQPAVNGVATFGNLSINNPGNGSTSPQRRRPSSGSCSNRRRPWPARRSRRTSPSEPRTASEIRTPTSADDRDPEQPGRRHAIA
jgi:adhesin/invasin